MVESLILPKPITTKEEESNTAHFSIEPLYPGYGRTIGNSLRRILLSSLPGSAVSAMLIPDVNHEFSTLEDVKEDVVDIMLNLKLVRFRVDGEQEEPIKIEIDFKGKGKVLAKEFKTPTGVGIVSPDAHIATVTKDGGEFKLVAYITQGRGFLPVEAREKEKLEVNTIAVDAIYSPVRRVAVGTEHVRVGQMTNFDKVTLTVETDGSISPKEAMTEAIQIYRDQLAALVFENGSSVDSDSEKEIKETEEESTEADESKEEDSSEEIEDADSEEENKAVLEDKKGAQKSKKADNKEE